MKPIIPLLLLVPVAATATVVEKPKPNLLVVMADQFRGRALGFLGEEPVLTPNLDKFAQRSVVLNQAVSGYPVSSPARGMFMTGMYPHMNGVTYNCNSQSAPYNVELRNEIVCWSDILKAEGYAMGYIGKWHLDSPYEPFINTSNNLGGVAWNEWCPPERRHGFDYWMAYGTYDRHLRPMYWRANDAREDFFYVDQWGPEYEADLAIDFIAKNKTKPFAMMVSMNPPHTGYEQVPQRYQDIYKGLNVDSIAASLPNLVNTKHFKNSLANYYACITGVDEQFGRILDELERSGVLENTIVIFTSDHGDIMGIHNIIGKNIYYEEAMRVPFMISYGGLKPRLDNELLFSLEDFYPTVISMMGLNKKIPTAVQTRDLSAQIKGSKRKMPTSQFYMWYPNGDAETLATNGMRGLRNLKYTLGAEWKGGKATYFKLFDRQSDPFELTDISGEQPAMTEKLKNEMFAIMRNNHDPLVKSIE